MNIVQRTNIKNILSKLNIKFNSNDLDTFQNFLVKLGVGQSTVKGPIAISLGLLVEEHEGFEDMDIFDVIKLSLPIADDLSGYIRCGYARTYKGHELIINQSEKIKDQIKGEIFMETMKKYEKEIKMAYELGSETNLQMLYHFVNDPYPGPFSGYTNQLRKMLMDPDYKENPFSGNKEKLLKFKEVVDLIPEELDPSEAGFNGPHNHQNIMWWKSVLDAALKYAV